jgi:hypothetical protein
MKAFLRSLFQVFRLCNFDPVSSCHSHFHGPKHFFKLFLTTIHNQKLINHKTIQGRTMSAICQHVRFHDRIETIDRFHLGLHKNVQFVEPVTIRETFHRDDLSLLEASMYWQTPFDVFHRRREIQTSFLMHDPTLNKYRPENMMNIRETIQRSRRAVLREQDNYRGHLQEQDYNHRRNSKFKGPCCICTCNPDRVAFAYRLEGRLLISEEAVPHLQGNEEEGGPLKRKLDLSKGLKRRLSSSKQSQMDAHDRKKFVAASA